MLSKWLVLLLLCKPIETPNHLVHRPHFYIEYINDRYSLYLLVSLKKGVSPITFFSDHTVVPTEGNTKEYYHQETEYKPFPL